MRPMSLNRPVHSGSVNPAVPAVSGRGVVGLMAPDRWSATEDNGVAVPPAEIHILIVIPNAKAFEYLKDKVFVVQPPYWSGKVHLHCVPDDPQSKWHAVPWTIRQALIDSGLATAEKVDMATPEQVTLGWPKEN